MDSQEYTTQDFHDPFLDGKHFQYVLIDPCIRAEEVRAWFHDNPSDESLAEALAQVCNRVGVFRHECDENNDKWLDYFFLEWSDLEEELLKECFARLEKKGALPNVEGWHYKILPFMRENGYRDGSGWWIKETNLE